jgi:hypothetical protein
MADWHPTLASYEVRPGCWQLREQDGTPYAEIELVRRGAEIGYRATFHGRVIGYYRTLFAGCAAAHGAFVRAHGAPEFRGYPDMKPRGQ